MSDFILKDFVSIVREWGIGLLSSDQIPSEISQFYFSNIATLIMFRHSDGNDLSKLQQSSGATRNQMMDNYSLQPGEAIVRTSKCKDLIKITIPFEKHEKFIAKTELDHLMKPVLKKLYADVISSKKKEKPSVEKKRSLSTNQSLRLHAQEKQLLHYLANHFDQPASLAYRACGLSSSAGFRIKERLITKNLITPVNTNLGKNGKRALYLVPNPVVFEQVRIPVGPGRGKLLHKYFQSQVVIQVESLGFQAVIEENSEGTPSAPDVGLKKLSGMFNIGFRIAVEIGITSRPAMEANHISKNLRLGYDHVILSFINRQVLEKTKQIAQEKYTENERSKVSFCLVNDISTVAKEVSDG